MWTELNVSKRYEISSAHPTLAFLAGCGSDGRVEILNVNESSSSIERVNKEIRKEGFVVQLAWHPSLPILVITWSTGVLSLWSFQDMILRDTKAHQASVHAVHWSPNGSRLISADEDGHVVVWKVDARGKPSASCKYRINSKLAHFAFRTGISDKECPPFFLCGEDHVVHYADDMGHTQQPLDVKDPIRKFLYNSVSDSVLIITQSLSFVKYAFTVEGKLKVEFEFKLSTGSIMDVDGLDAIWTLPNQLAVVIPGRPFLQIWDIDNREKLNLSTEASASAETCYLGIAYCGQRSLLTASTNRGHVYTWMPSVPEEETEENSAQEWVMHDVIKIQQKYTNLSNMAWGFQGKHLLIRIDDDTQLISEQVMAFSAWNKNIVIQSGPMSFVLDREEMNAQEVTLPNPVRKLSITDEKLCVWTGKTLEIYDFSEGALSPSANTPLATLESMAMNDQAVFLGSGQRLDIMSHFGSIKQTITNSSFEGGIEYLHCNSSFLLMSTKNNYFKVYDISRKEPRLLSTKKVEKAQGVAKKACINSSGTAACFLIGADNTSGLLPSFLFDGNSEGLAVVPIKLGVFDFDNDQLWLQDLAKVPANATPSCQWDFKDPRMLVVDFADAKSCLNVVSYFFSPEDGILEHDDHKIEQPVERLLAANMPNLFFEKSTIASDPSAGVGPILRMRAPDFANQQTLDDTTVQSMLNFQYFISIGNIDQAFKAVRAIKGNAIWESLLRTCIKTKRFDVATMCLGNLGDVKTQRALRAAQNETDDVKAAILAVYVGMHDKVPEMFMNAGKIDLLAKFYEATDQWETSLKLVGSKARVSLNATFYKFGEHLRKKGDFNGAIAAYEKSSTFSYLIPRLLMYQKNEGMLEYVKSAENVGLKRWYAQYLETQEDYAGSLSLYEHCKDEESTVRLLCRSERFEEAMAIFELKKSPSSALFIARGLEDAGKFAQAITYYTYAKCPTQGVRLAKQHGLDSELGRLALQGPPESMLEVAKHFEEKNELQKAIPLYHRAGAISKAIELSMKTLEYSLLLDIAKTSGSKIDPSLMPRLTDFFLDHRQYDKAVSMLFLSKKFTEGMNLASEKSVTLTEDIVNGIPGTAEDDPNFDRVLVTKLADCLLQQQQYHLACKKYTQLGDRIKAMNALLRSGDVNKIIFFAGVSGPVQKDIFIMAANFLQSQNWKADPNILKSIITFYTKARAFDSLALFYDSCARSEIDEYQNYEKAVGAFQEAVKCYEKAKNAAKVEEYERKMELISHFATVQSLPKDDLEGITKACQGLLGEPNINDSVRIGDIYSLLVETNVLHGNREEAVQLLSKMKGLMPLKAVRYYISEQMLEVLGEQVDAGSPDTESPIEFEFHEEIQ